MTARSLPIFEPRLRGRLHHSLPQSIISDTERFDPWFYSNYIQLYCNKGANTSADVNFYEYFLWVHPFPPVEAQRMTRDVLAATGVDLIHFIVKNVDLGHYFYTYVDEYYVPLQCYQVAHFIRDFIIFGYDLESGHFDAFGMDKHMQLSKVKVSFEQFLDGYNNMVITGEYQKDNFLLKPRHEPVYDFDSVLVRDLLEDYLLSRNTSERFRMCGNPIDALFGMDVHRHYLEDLQLAKETEAVLSYVPVHTFWEHKKCMLERMEYMSKHQHLDAAKLAPIAEEYRYVEKKWKTLRNMILKRFQTGNDPSIDRIIELVEELGDRETETLNKLLALMKSE